MQYIVNDEWLLDRLHDEDIRIIDCRFPMSTGTDGRQLFLKDHIPGAVYCDLEVDLSRNVSTHGGRHPIPSKKSLETLFGRLGIEKTTKVVIYDDQGGAMAARLWFLLRYAGHTKAFILNGGYSVWKSAGLPISDEHTEVKETKFVGNFQNDIIVDMEEVQRAIIDDNTILIDSREEKRYKGIHEPLDPIAGHIPSAVNYFWKDLLDETGKWKSDEEIKARFAQLPKEKSYIVYCGSGVTACPNILALIESGYKNVKLYGGSWSDWCSYKDNEIEK
ncbi:sulfurtransferase [Lottiidibacillus patelloidae]|uniref:Sulfurtransferase n=1 Tax=Lottiidibacillus patelloidae TaxID=2670334 RepID=A0A263BUU0_9BACI|nr:sulfurtransferase [Lottiidibacillus patelloidae]OZM57465.1 sulfurtransferase [Lottiidibacillus patelloidae]